MRSFASAEASLDELDEIRRLLVAAFGDRFSAHDWDHTLGGQHVVVAENDRVLSHAAVVERVIDLAGRSLRVGYVEGVATHPARQREGLGTLAMSEVRSLVRGGFEMGALSTGRHAFYSRLGWVRWRGPTFVRDGAVTVRTPDEDDGIMAFCFGPSADIDVNAAITCEARPGDDW